jgi:hypothetical protein
MSLFDDFQKHLQYGIDDNINEDSMRGIMNKIMPPPQKPAGNGL